MNWTPDKQQTLLWLDLSDPEKVYTNTIDQVTYVLDQSANNNLILPVSDLTRPALATIGGSQALVFNSDALTVPTIPSDAATWTMFFVAEVVDANEFSLAGNTDDTYIPITAPSASGSNTDILRIHGAKNPAGAEILFDGELSQSVATRPDVHAKFNSGGGVLAVFDNIPPITTAWEIGRGGGSTTWYMDGKIGEVIVTPYPSLADRQKIEGYLAHKWGLSAKLPADHPFKNEAPQVEVQPDGQASLVSGVVQVDGLPASRTVRAFSYEDVEHTINGELVTSSLSLGTAVSNPGSGEYTINLLSAYQKPVFVVAFDDYGKPFQALKTLKIGDRIHPTSPNGYVWECTSAGDLPEEEPVWSTDTETGQIYGTATLIARPFYRPMVHGPIAPEVIAGAVDDYFSSVISLVHFDDDLSDITGKSWIKFGAAESYVTGLFGKAIALNGQSGNYLQSDSAEYALGAEDFTIEFWIYRDGEPAGWATALAIRSTSSQAFSKDTTGVYIAADEALAAIRINSVTVNVGDSTPIPQAKWTHIALTRQNGVARYYLDGAKIGADVAVSGSIGGNKVVLGVDDFAQNGVWPGMIEELRITKGVARYSGNFDVPTQAFPNQGPPPTDEHFDNVLSLMHFDGDIKDVTGRQWFATGSAEANNKQAKFGGGSLDVPANGSLYTEDVADFDFGVGDFTIEFFVYTRSINQTTPTMLCTGGSSWATGASTLRIEAGKGIVLYVFAIPGATVLDPQPIALNTWVHVALTRENGIFRLFKNGALISENATKTTIALNMGFGGSLTVGASKYGDPTYDGCFEELRITKGVARYVAEFTPPDEPFPDQGPAVKTIEARYWRINATANAGSTNNYVHVGYIRFIGPATASDTESVTPISSGDLTTTYSAAKAFDPSLAENMRWVSSTIPAWIGCEFGAPVEITSVEITPDAYSQHADQLPADFTIEYSDDGTNWQVASTHSGVLEWAESTPLTFSV